MECASDQVTPTHVLRGLKAGDSSGATNAVILEVTTADPGQAWDPHSMSHSLQDWKEKYIHENYTKALSGKLVETVGGAHNPHLLLWECIRVEIQ